MLAQPDDPMALGILVVVDRVAVLLDRLPDPWVDPRDLRGSGVSIAEPRAESVRRDREICFGQLKRAGDADGKVLPSSRVGHLHTFGEHLAGGHPVFAYLSAGAYGVLLPDSSEERRVGDAWG